MSYEFKTKRMEKAVVNDIVNKETVEDIKLYPIVENLQRGITKETCMKFGVRAALSEKDGKTPTAYYFPSYNQKGEVIGYKKQDVTKNKDEKYHWTSVGTVAIGNKLFGQNVAEQINRKHTNCVYTEGEWDCLSVFQAQCDSVKGTKYEGHQPFVVSIPLGTKNSVESMLHNKDFVQSFQSMTIFFDDDEATPLELKKGVMKGKEAREAVAAAFIGGIELWSVQPTNGKKDASDYMQAGQSSELAKLVQFGRKPLVTEKIVKANVLSLEDIIKKREEGIYISAFPNLMDKIHGFRKRELVLLTAPSGTGKCHGVGTKIRMADMSVKNVEDVIVGDFVMGADGSPRKVLNLSSGFGKLYRVDQVKGDSYIVNENHLLSLKASIKFPSEGVTAGDVVNVKLSDWLCLSNWKKGMLKGYKANLTNLGEGSCEDLLDSYMLGLWLAVGTASKPQITVNKADKELIDQVYSYATYKGYTTNVCPSMDRSGSIAVDFAGGYLVQLRAWGVLNNKHIPTKFLTADYETRLALLAGILDGDGYLNNNGFELTLKKNELVKDLILLARSVGLAVSVADKVSTWGNGGKSDVYTRLHIYGDTVKVPNRLSRKKCGVRKQVKNALCTGVSVTQIEDGVYYGFEIDGDHLYCLEDFTVTHNSTVTSIFADAFVDHGEKVGMIFLEEEIKDTVQRLIASRLKVSYIKFKSDPLSCASQEQIQEAYEYIVNQDRVVLLDHFGSLPVSELMAKIKHMHFVEGCSYILLDHLSMVISGSQVADERKELDMVMTELAAFCASNDVCIIAVSHINRTGADQFKPPKGKENESYWVRITKESMRGCVDAKTEFLSQNGWKSFADYEDGDVVMQYTDKGCVEYVKPLDYINLPCDEFIHFKSNKGCDMMLSEEHRLMFATEKRKGSINFKLAKDVYDEHHNNTTGFRGIIPTTFKSNGSLTLLDESKLRVQVALNADGWVVNQNTSRCAVRVKKPRKVERMRKLLKDANMDFNEIQLSESRVEFHFTSPTGYKGITPEWFNLTQEQLIVISDEVQYWDCDINSGRFTSINKLEADFIQFVYSATGNRSVISVVEAGENLLPMNNGSGESKMYKTQQQYRVSKSLNKFISFRKTTNSKTEVAKVESQGSRKYCFTVPSGMLLVRRNGKVFITGNSASLEQLSWTILGLEPEILPDRSRGNVRLTVLKNRTWGFLGEADEFYIDQNTWEVILANNQPTQVSSPQTVTIKPKCLDDDLELGF